MTTAYEVELPDVFRYWDDWADTHECPSCHRVARALRDAGALRFNGLREPCCASCDEVLDDGALDPSDDVCDFCGFPRFDCQCEDDDCPDDE